MSFGLTAGSYHPLAYEPAFADGDRTFAYSLAQIDSSTTNGPTSLSDYDNFGSSVASIGDIDGDGIDDIAVGAPYSYAGGSNRGAIYIIMLNSDGTPKKTDKIAHGTTNGPDLRDGAQFGRSMASIGDIDGDGIDDIAVGAPYSYAGGSNRGAIYIIMLNSDGTPKKTDKIAHGTTNGPDLHGSAQFGSSVANIGDIDNDGIDDIGVVAFGDGTEDSDYGGIYIIMLNSDGTPKKTDKIAHGTTSNSPYLRNNPHFGISANIGDINGDGIDDIAVGAPSDGTGGPNRGAIRIIMLDSDGTTKKTVRMAHDPTNGPDLRDGAQFGRSVANIGDIDGDGIDDIAVGASGSNTIYIMFLVTVPGKPTGLTAVPGNAQVVLSWSKPAETGGAPITDYKIEYSNDDGGSTWTVFNDGTTADTTATVTGLTNGQEYSFRASAINSVGTGTASDAATVTVGLFASPNTQTISATLDEPTCVISLAQENLVLGNVQYSHWSDWATQTVTNDGNQQVTGMILDADDWKASDGNKLDKAYSQIDKNGIKRLDKGSHNIPDEIPFNKGTIDIKYRINLEDIRGGDSAGKTFTQTVTYLATCS